MSSVSSFNYEHVGDTYDEIMAHYKANDCSYARRKLSEFQKEVKNAELVNSNAAAFEKLVRAQKHIRVINDFLASASSCTISGGRSRRVKKSKRTRRVKKSKRTRRVKKSKRTRRNH